MSNSKLAKYDCRSVLRAGFHYNISRTQSISMITIHHMAGISPTAKECASWWKNTQASSNYGIGNDGSIGLYVNESSRCYTTSSGDNDNRAVTIEVSNDTNSGTETSGWTVSDKAMASLILLCADICKRNNISELKYVASDKNRCHIGGRIDFPLSGNMTKHKWFKVKNCPGPYLESLFPTIAKEVTDLMKSGATSYTWKGQTIDGLDATSDISSDDVDIVDKISTSINIDIKNLTPFVVTVDPTVTKINYDKLKKLQVSGMMFEAGYLYESGTHIITTYQNGNLMKQVKDCNEAGLKFALYAIVRARNIDEADEECKYLWYVISKFPPGMGLWLKLEFPNNQSIKKNNKILDRYLEYIERWGLKNGCGIYCNKEMIERIDWNTYQNDFFLWYMNMFQEESEFNQVSDKLITPNFFQLIPTDPEIINNTIENTNNTSSTIPSDTSLGTSTGADVVRYARQFIGNPYVWGGESLTNGCDCSGFTMKIFEHFGVSLPHSSKSQRSYGKAVSNLKDAVAGDLICYFGHVGIYNGSGGLVHASNPRDGIKESASCTYKPILAIRRLV